MRKPTDKEITKFIEVFDKLSQFEAEQRVTRGSGCFSEEDLPFKEVKKVTKWLKSKVSTNDKDAVDVIIAKYERKVEELRIESASAQAMNDYILYETLNEEADIYENIVTDLKDIGGIGRIKYK